VAAQCSFHALLAVSFILLCVACFWVMLRIRAQFKPTNSFIQKKTRRRTT
jgi:hypothetical protein